MAKKESKYIITDYMVDGEPNGWNIIKLDADGEPAGRYYINKTRSNCNCPARVPYCRHKKMLTDALERGYINTGHIYDMGSYEWSEPTNIDVGLYEGMFKDPSEDDMAGKSDPSAKSAVAYDLDKTGLD